MANLDILSARYTTPKINDIFSENGTIRAERDLWIAVMKAQKQLGVNIPSEDIERFEKAKNHIDLKKINEIERLRRHDVKAKIEAFVDAAEAGEHIHKGMTSRDLTDNVEQMKIKNASKIIFGKYISILRHFIDKAKEYHTISVTARTHHQPAQLTLLGRRFSMWAEELYEPLLDFEKVIDTYPLRGIKGPVGTQSDMLRLLGSKEKVKKLEENIAKTLGFRRIMISPGQVYPRSLDYKIISHLAFLTASCENFAKGMRLMAGHELVTEGFKEGQTGSSAMPHKMNTRSSERICGLSSMIKTYVDGLSRISGDQWEEGDVSCSVPRRVLIPGSFYASDGLCETTLTVLNEMGSYQKVIEEEVDKYLPFLATTSLLTAAVQAGIGREEAHSTIKKHAIDAALKMRYGEKTDLVRNLSLDPVFQKAEITIESLKEILSDKKKYHGNASQQIFDLAQKVRYFTQKYPAEARYEPGNIL